MNAVGKEQFASERGIAGMVENGPREEERLQAMKNFAKNVKVGEYVDCDIYGRGEIHVVSDVSIHGNQEEGNEAQRTTGTPQTSSTNMFMVPVSYLGKKVRNFVSKLSGTTSCLGRRRSEASDEKEEAELMSPITYKSDETSAGHLSGSNDDQHVAKDERLMFVRVKHVEPMLDEKKSQSKLVLGNNVDEKEGVTNAVVEATIAEETDGITHRVKCKVGSGDDTSVVEKGTVSRTLAKLRSTGSFAFQEPISVGHTASGNSEDLPGRETSNPTRTTNSSGDCGIGAVEHRDTVGERETAASWDTQGRVEKLKSAFEEEVSQTPSEPVVPDGIDARNTHLESRTKSSPLDASCENSLEGKLSTHVSEENGKILEISSLKQLSSHLSGRVQELRSFYECDSLTHKSLSAEEKEAEGQLLEIHQGLSHDSAAYGDDSESQDVAGSQGENGVVVACGEQAVPSTDGQVPKDTVLVNQIQGLKGVTAEEAQIDAVSSKEVKTMDDGGSREMPRSKREADLQVCQPGTATQEAASLSQNVSALQVSGSGENSVVENIDQSVTPVSSVVSTVDLSRPMSQLVESCSIM